MAFFTTVLVSLYAVWMDKQLAKVHPSPVNLHSVSQARYVQRINSDPHVFIVSDARNLDTEVLTQQQSMYGGQSDDSACTTCSTTFVIMLKILLL